LLPLQAEPGKDELPECNDTHKVIIASVDEQPSSVWADFGDGEFKQFSFHTEAEQNAFANGILTAANEWGIDDFRLLLHARAASPIQGRPRVVSHEKAVLKAAYPVVSLPRRSDRRCTMPGLTHCLTLGFSDYL
jgi:hypothetical protein